MKTDWSIAKARELYSVAHWGGEYFDVGPDGRLLVRPRGAGGTAVPLAEIVEAAQAKGQRLPLLVRCSDVLADRLARLQSAFADAMACGRERRFVVIAKVATFSKCDEKVTMLDTSKPRPW